MRLIIDLYTLPIIKRNSLLLIHNKNDENKLCQLDHLKIKYAYKTLFQ